MKRWISLIVLLILMTAGAAHAQDENPCSAAALHGQVSELIKAYQAVPPADDAAERSAAGALQDGIAAILTACDNAPVTLDDTGIPLNSWVVVEAPADNDVLNQAAQPYQADPTCFYAYLYVDHTAGTTLRVESFCTRDASGAIIPTDGPAANDEALLLRYDVFSPFELTAMTGEQRASLKLPEVPDWLATYQDETIDAVRAIHRLDTLRSPGFPDDIQVILPPKEEGANAEQVWCRLESQLEEDVFECELLNEPYADYGLKVGDRLAVQLREQNGTLLAIVVGKMRK